MATVITTERLKVGETLDLTLELTNTGSRAGFEVVQLYVRDPECRVA